MVLWELYRRGIILWLHHFREFFGSEDDKFFS